MSATRPSMPALRSLFTYFSYSLLPLLFTYFTWGDATCISATPLAHNPCHFAMPLAYDPCYLHVTHATLHVTTLAAGPLTESQKTCGSSSPIENTFCLRRPVAAVCQATLLKHPAQVVDRPVARPHRRHLPDILKNHYPSVFPV